MRPVINLPYQRFCLVRAHLLSTDSESVLPKYRYHHILVPYRAGQHGKPFEKHQYLPFTTVPGTHIRTACLIQDGERKGYLST